jgi:hypothetical protein
VTTTFSHEIAEAISDPDHGNGIIVTPPAGLPSYLNTGILQIGRYDR